MPSNKEPLAADTGKGSEPENWRFTMRESKTVDPETQMLDYKDHCRDMGLESKGGRINWAEAGL